MTVCKSRWSVYMLRCGDGSLYTGIATDVKRRLEKHRADAGAKYLRGRGPLEVVFQSEMGSRSLATRAEARIKKLSRAAKEEFLAARGPLDLLADLRVPEPVRQGGSAQVWKKRCRP
ncbi:MAG TPA: GIY-YIG nuclease family protein [Woeseiaceae bacterium]|nr:GIY-YIG nuclease family protein [Woeseiaceae bacterium]